MIPLRDSTKHSDTAVVTWTIIVLVALIYLWDRGGELFSNSIAFADLAMQPNQITRALTSADGDRTQFVTLFTSLFMHAGIAHLAGNILFLAVFGPTVERTLGGARFALYYLFWGVFASAAHVFVNPHSQVPVVGASGAIGGVLGAYFLLYPANRITVLLFPFVFTPFAVSSAILLGIWFLWQVFFPQEGVANWAHAGGFMAGMLTILLMGGREKVLAMMRPDDEGEEEAAPPLSASGNAT